MRTMIRITPENKNKIELCAYERLVAEEKTLVFAVEIPDTFRHNKKCAKFMQWMHQSLVHIQKELELALKEGRTNAPAESTHETENAAQLQVPQMAPQASLRSVPDDNQAN